MHEMQICLGKRKNSLHSQFLISYEETRDFAKVVRKQKGTQKGCFLKPTILLFLFFPGLFFSLPWKLWPQLGCKYASFAFLVNVPLF